MEYECEWSYKWITWKWMNDVLWERQGHGWNVVSEFGLRNTKWNLCGFHLILPIQMGFKNFIDHEKINHLIPREKA